MPKQSKKQNPENRRRIAASMKLHLRVIRAGGAEYRVLALRPGTDVSFSTNYYHECWHIISSERGARMLGRLLWGVSYQRKAGSAVLLYGEHIVPTPFGAEPSDPILLAVEGSVQLKADSLRALRRKVIQQPPDRTVLFRTHGLDEFNDYLASQEAGSVDGQLENRWKQLSEADESPQQEVHERIRRIGGVICYTAPANTLRKRAVEVASIVPCDWMTRDGMEYRYLHGGQGMRYSEGEIQVFGAFDIRRWAAERARAFVVESGVRYEGPEAFYAAVAQRRDELLEQTDYGRKYRNPDRRKQVEDVESSFSKFQKAQSTRSWLSTERNNAKKSLGIPADRPPRPLEDDLREWEE